MRTTCAVKDVRLSHLEMTLAHHLFLDGVLHVFDVDEGLPADVEAIGDRTCDVDCGLGVEVQREERLTHSDLDLGLTPRHDLTVAADQTNGDWLALVGAQGLITTEHEAAGYIVRIALDECFFNQQMDIVRGQLERAALIDLSGQDCAHTVCDLGNKLLIHIGKNVLLITRQEQIGQGSADCICDFCEVEIALAAFGFDLDFWTLETVLTEHAGPVETWLLFFRCGGVTFEFEIFFE